MGDIGSYMSGVVEKLSAVLDDIQRIKFNEEAPPDKQKDMKSLQPVTRLRANKADAQEAAANPEITFIMDQIDDAFKD